MTCPRCGEGVAAGQEYCLDCGLRLPGDGRLGPPPTGARRVVVPLAFAAVVAIVGASLAIALTRETATATTIVTATGGSEVVQGATTTGPPRVERWPRGTSGWTNVVVSVPKIDGRDAAVARAEQALRRGLDRVGVLDSSRYASLHPGYWVVFAGIYPSQPEAASHLREVKAVQKGARTQRVSA